MFQYVRMNTPLTPDCAVISIPPLTPQSLPSPLDVEDFLDLVHILHNREHMILLDYPSSS